MPIENATTVHNELTGHMVHYYNGSGNPCHLAFLQGDCFVDNTGSYPEFFTATLIQIDSLSLGVVVPTILTNVASDDTIATSPSFHEVNICNRG